jgi:hypothetical protein
MPYKNRKRKGPPPGMKWTQDCCGFEPIVGNELGAQGIENKESESAAENIVVIPLGESCMNCMAHGDASNRGDTTEICSSKRQKGLL